MGSIISDFLSRSKALFEGNKGEDIFLVILIIIIGFGGFGLGRLSALEDTKTPVRIEKGDLQAAVSESGDSPSAGADIATGGLFVASKNGSKYHFPWCSGAQRIKEENKVWFESAEEAKRAGYSKAANCKGL